MATNSMATGMPDGRQTLDLAVYLASLASDAKAIDPLLDSVRLITAKVQPGDPIAAADQERLQQVCGQLQQHLVTKEKVRSFTPKELQGRIAEFLRGAPPRPQGLRRVIPGAGIVTAALIGVVMLLPFPLPLATRGLAASSVFFMMAHLTAAWFFVTALRTFAPNLRRAYLLIAMGVVVLGLTQIVQPIVQILNLESTPYNTLFSVLPLIPGYLLMYAGAQRFAQAIHRSSRWLEPPALAGYLLAAMALGIALPHAGSSESPFLLDAIFALQACNITIAITLAFLLSRIQGFLTSLYAQPVRLFLAFALVSIGIGVYMYIVNGVTGGVPSQVMLIPLILAIIVNGFILLRAGYQFNRGSQQ